MTKQRSYAASSYLKEALAKKASNLRIITNALVSKVVLDSANPGNVVVTGVEFTPSGSSVSETLHARKEVILAAGAIKSPEILELSGIGDPRVCHALGIPCVIENPNVGENLQTTSASG